MKKLNPEVMFQLAQLAEVAKQRGEADICYILTEIVEIGCQFNRRGIKALKHKIEEHSIDSIVDWAKRECNT